MFNLFFLGDIGGNLVLCRAKSETPSATASRSLPSFRFGFIALVLNSYKSWSSPTRAKLAKLIRLLNRVSQKESLISPVH